MWCFMNLTQALDSSASFLQKNVYVKQVIDHWTLSRCMISPKRANASEKKEKGFALNHLFKAQLNRKRQHIRCLLHQLPQWHRGGEKKATKSIKKILWSEASSAAMFIDCKWSFKQRSLKWRQKQWNKTKRIETKPVNPLYDCAILCSITSFVIFHLWLFGWIACTGRCAHSAPYLDYLIIMISTEVLSSSF